jgi:hypothetical protein
MIQSNSTEYNLYNNEDDDKNKEERYSTRIYTDNGDDIRNIEISSIRDKRFNKNFKYKVNNCNNNSCRKD